MTKSIVSLAFVSALILGSTAAGSAVTLSLTPDPASQVTLATFLQTTGPCAKPNLDAKVDAAVVSTPTIAQDQNVEGSTVVHVDLRADGSLASSALAGSSGNWYLDAAAMRAARTAEYSPEIRACQPIAGAYLLRVDF